MNREALLAAEVGGTLLEMKNGHCKFDMCMRDEIISTFLYSEMC
jgi:hypothetical protein